MTKVDFTYDIKQNLNDCEKHVNSVILRMNKMADEIPKWLSSVKKNIDDIILGSGDISVATETSVFELTQRESLTDHSPHRIINTDNIYLKKSLSRIYEELSCDVESTDGYAIESQNISFNDSTPPCISKTELPKPEKIAMNTNTKKTIEKSYLPKSNHLAATTKIPISISDTKHKENINKNTEKSKRTFQQMTKSTTIISNMPVNVGDVSDIGKSFDNKVNTPCGSSVKGKMAKCEMLQHHKKEQIKMKQEEKKTKTMNRIIANRERRMKAEDERLQKYKYEELRKQVAREKIAELNKHTKKSVNRQLTPIKFKIHNTINSTTLYTTTGKDTPKPLIPPTKRKELRHPQSKVLETIPDVTVNETIINESIVKTTQELNDTLPMENQNCGGKFTVISSTPFNNTRNLKNTNKNLDVTFSENSSHVSPIDNFVAADETKINFSSAVLLPEIDVECVDNEGNRRETFVIEEGKNLSTDHHQYDMTIVDSQDTSDDDDEYYIQCSDNNKPIPDWAKSEKIWSSVTQQIVEKKLSADSIFGPIPRVNINDIFKSTHRDFNNRNSSGFWNDSIDIL